MWDLDHLPRLRGLLRCLIGSAVWPKMEPWRTPLQQLTAELVARRHLHLDLAILDSRIGFRSRFQLRRGSRRSSRSCGSCGSRMCPQDAIYRVFEVV